MGMKDDSLDKRNKNLLIVKQMKRAEKQEARILNRQENAFYKANIAPVIDKIQDKIPDKLKSVLDAAFYKGFQLVFEKGNSYIEMTYNKDKLQLEHDLNNYAIDKYHSRKHIGNMDKKSNLSTTLNSSIAVLEGGVLGFLGIGLPDIPLFLAVVIRSINEIALSYGFQYDTKEEKLYLLNVICAAMAKGEKQMEYDRKLNQIGEQIDSSLVVEINLEESMRETADLLSDSLLTAKFIQGIPFIGAVGGVVNHTIINKIGKYAKVKYKKRYLMSKLV